MHDALWRVGYALPFGTFAPGANWRVRRDPNTAAVGVPVGGIDWTERSHAGPCRISVKATTQLDRNHPYWRHDPAKLPSRTLNEFHPLSTLFPSSGRPGSTHGRHHRVL
jgi:hypothetical protein